MTQLEPVLCYVEGCWLFFTTCPLDKQWGDDWDDAPYEHNAGRPYEWDEYMLKDGCTPYVIYKLAYEGPYEAPCDRANGNSHFSVEQINQRQIAWLLPRSWNNKQHVVPVFAGETMSEVKAKIQASGGIIYEPAATDQPTPRER